MLHASFNPGLFLWASEELFRQLRLHKNDSSFRKLIFLLFVCYQ